MNYQETIAYLYNSAPLFQQVGKAAYKEGLENTDVAAHKNRPPFSLHAGRAPPGWPGTHGRSHFRMAPSSAEETIRW